MWSWMSGPYSLAVDRLPRFGAITMCPFSTFQAGCPSEWFFHMERSFPLKRTTASLGAVPGVV